MELYRIEKKKYIKTYPPIGSKFVDGRWSTTDMWVVYTSENIALAKLEILANSGSYIPKNRYLMILELDDNAPILEITTKDLPKNWYRYPYPKSLAKTIGGIMEEEKYLGVIVPSAQSHRENNILLFPDFPDFEKYVRKVEVDKSYFDKRLK